MTDFKIARRGLLKGLLAAPIAARQAGEHALKQMGYAAGSDVLMAAPLTAMDQAAPMPHATAEGFLAKFRVWFAKNGLPKWKREECAERAYINRIHHGIDPDLAVLRSVAPIYKAQQQRIRNISREEQAAVARIVRDVQREKFAQTSFELLGDKLYWHH